MIDANYYVLVNWEWVNLGTFEKGTDCRIFRVHSGHPVIDFDHAKNTISMLYRFRSNVTITKFEYVEPPKIKRGSDLHLVAYPDVDTSNSGTIKTG